MLAARARARARGLAARGGLRSMGTFSRQSGLPALPLGEVDATLDKFLQTASPFLQTNEERREVEALVAEAKKDAGVLEAQKKLEEIAKNDKNWLDRFWTSNAYMKWDVALPINSNVTGYLFGEARKKWDQAFSAAAVTRGALLHHIDLLEERVPVKEARGGAAQCMDQYSRMFSLTRIPGVEEDQQVRYGEEEAQHVVVIAGRRAYAVPVLKGREVAPLADLRATMAAIRAEAQELGPDPRPVPVLTALPRKEWARVRNGMVNDEVNAKALRIVESAVFTISLEDGIDESDSACAKTCFVGDGRTTWFDKSFQLKVKEDGNPSINVEHSWADAPVPLGMFFNDALPYAESEAAKGVDLISGSPLAYQRVDFKVDEALAAEIEEAERVIDAEIANSDVCVYECKGLGRSVWKAAKLSPDAAVQMAMQLAWRRRTGSKVPPPTYETIGMVQYYKGRTETCRVVSDASEAFVQAALAGSPEAGALLRKACDAHIAYIQEGQSGRGIDRHLLGLRLQGASPALFKHPVFAQTTSFVLSTSNNSYVSRPFGGLFGCGLPNGYGVCYIPGKETVALCIESKHASPETDSLGFARDVDQALREIAALAGVQTAKL